MSTRKTEDKEQIAVSKPKKPRAVKKVESSSVIDASALSAMMAQMQSLMDEVGSLKSELTALKVVEPQLPEKFSNVLKSISEGEMNEEIDTSVSSAETSELLSTLSMATEHIAFETDSGGSEAENQDLEYRQSLVQDEHIVVAGKTNAAATSKLEDEEEFELSKVESLLGQSTSAPLLTSLEEGAADNVDSAPSENCSNDCEQNDDSEPVGSFSQEELSDEAIAAMLSGAVQGESPEDLEVQAIEESAGNLSDDEIASMLASAQTEEGEPSSSTESDFNEDDEELLSEEELAEMIRGEIARQDTELEEVLANPSLLEEPAQSNGGVLSADEIAKLLVEPDPHDGHIPAKSQAMDEDELAELLAQVPASTSKPISVPTELPVDVLPSSNDDAERGSNESETRTLEHSHIDVPDVGAIKAVPAFLAIRAMALPMCFSEGKLVCHVAEPFDQPALDRLSKAVGLGIVTVPKPIVDIVSGLRDAYAEVRDEHARTLLRIEGEIKPTIGDKLKSIIRRIA